MSYRVGVPFDIFPDVDGKPLKNGYVYIGSSNVNPETNPVTVYWDSNLSIKAAQPIRTIDGYLSRNGSPGKLHLREIGHSITVRNKKKELVWSDLEASDTAGTTPTTVASVAIARTIVPVEGASLIITSKDGAGDLFVAVVGNSGLVNDSVGFCGQMIVPDGGDGTKGWERRTTELSSVHWGTSTSASIAENDIAFNEAFAYIRAQVNGASEDSVSLSTPYGQYSVSSINATAIRGAGWSWHCRGVTISGSGAGKTTVDLLHSRQYSIYGLVVEGDDVDPPRTGIQTGYISNAVSAGLYTLNGVHTKGDFTLTGYHNGGGEEATHVGCQFENEINSADAYCVIEDGWNFWGKRSDYVTHSAVNNHIAVAVSNITQANPAVCTAPGHTFSNGDKVPFYDVTGMIEVNSNYCTVANSDPGAGTFELSGIDSTAFTAYTSGGFVHELQPQSFVQAEFVCSSAFKSGGGPGIWMSGNVARHNWRSSYCHSADDNGVVIKIDHDIQATQPHQLHLDIGFEGTNLLHAVYFDRTGTTNLTFRMGSFYLKDHGPQCQTALIGTNDASASSVYEFTGGILDIANFAGTSKKVFDIPAKYKFVGEFKTRNFAAVENLADAFYGKIILADANVAHLPAGSYDIDAGNFAGSAPAYGIHKGGKRFYASNAAVASGALSGEDFTQIDGEGVLLSELTSTPSDQINGDVYYRSKTLKFYDGTDTNDVASGQLAAIADDAAKSFNIPGGVSAMCMVSCNGGDGPHSLVWVRGTSAASSLFSTAQALVDVTTGILTGTTGTDTHFTISAHSDGKMYLENRTGSVLTVALTWMSRA